MQGNAVSRRLPSRNFPNGCHAAGFGAESAAFGHFITVLCDASAGTGDPLGHVPPPWGLTPPLPDSRGKGCLLLVPP